MDESLLRLFSILKWARTAGHPKSLVLPSSDIKYRSDHSVFKQKLW